MKKSILTLGILFAFLAAVQAQIVITEIMYNPPPGGVDTLEYVELYNNSSNSVDISGWRLYNANTTFPAGTVIPANGYVITTENKAYFDARFPGLTSFQWTSDALTNGGEKLTLTKADTTQIVDEVTFDDAAPWPGGLANGNGASIVLCDPNSDNNNGANWQAAITNTSVVIQGIAIKANPGAASGCSNAPKYPQRTIAQLTTENAQGVADSTGKTAEIRGFVYGGNLRASTTGLQFTIINNDNSAGIAIFSQNATFSYNVTEGDEIIVRGTVNQFRGLTQFLPDTIIKVSSNNALASPQVVTVPTEATESRLIRINNLVLVNPAEWTNTGTGFNARAVVPGTTDTVSIRIDNDVNLFGMGYPVGTFSIIGIGTQFAGTTAPFNSGYQIQPRYVQDILGTLPTHEADFSAEVRMQPNPVNDYLLLTLDLDFDALYISSAYGQLIQTITAPNRTETLDVTGFAPGMYTIRFQKDGAFWTTKFVKF